MRQSQGVADNVEGQVGIPSLLAAEVESMEACTQHGKEDKSASEVKSWMMRTFPWEEADRLIASLRSYVKEKDIPEEQANDATRKELLSLIKFLLLTTLQAMGSFLMLTEVE